MGDEVCRLLDAEASREEVSDIVFSVNYDDDDDDDDDHDDHDDDDHDGDNNLQLVDIRVVRARGGVARCSTAHRGIYRDKGIVAGNIAPV